MHNLTHICTIAGIRFFEHPTKGDEAPLVVIVNGDMVVSDFWDIPDCPGDVLDFMESVA